MFKLSCPCTSPFYKGIEISCVRCKPSTSVFVCLVTRKHCGCSNFHAHAPLHFTNAFKFCVLCVFHPLVCSFVLSLWVESGLPMHLSFSQKRSNFRISCVRLPLACSFVLWLGECFRLAHAPLLFTKAFELSCLVCKPSSCVFICLVTWGAFWAFLCTLLFTKHSNVRVACVIPNSFLSRTLTVPTHDPYLLVDFRDNVVSQYSYIWHSLRRESRYFCVSLMATFIFLTLLHFICNNISEDEFAQMF